MNISSPTALQHEYTLSYPFFRKQLYGSLPRRAANTLTVKPHFPQEAYDDLERILTVGTPDVFNGHLSRVNYNKYQRYGNHPTVAKYDTKIAKIVNKEERNKHLMTFPLWVQ